MAKLRDEYREQTKVVWRISFGKGTTLTDAQVIRAVYDLVDTNCDNLKYCEDARFMDIGHNEYLKTSEFISGMKSLEYVIVSGSMISDLKPFGNCKNLKVLEAAFCEYIESVEGLENLRKSGISEHQLHQGNGSFPSGQAESEESVRHVSSQIPGCPRRSRIVSKR